MINIFLLMKPLDFLKLLKSDFAGLLESQRELWLRRARTLGSPLLAAKSFNHIKSKNKHLIPV
jgi:hypothetical protein